MIRAAISGCVLAALSLLGVHGQIMPAPGPVFAHPTGSVTYVQGSYGYSPSTSIASPQTLTISGVTSGDFLLYSMAIGNVMISGVTDSVNTASMLFGGGAAWDGGANSAAMGYVANATAGSHTGSFTWSSGVGAYDGWQVMELHGADPTNPIDAQATPAAGTGNSVSCGSLTTTTANDMIVAFMTQGGGPIGAGPGYTLVSGETGYGQYEYISAATPGTYTPTGTGTTGAVWVCLAVAIKP